MAGHYFYDPRPYYGLNMSTNLMPLDELFHKYEPVPYWMDQRMAPMSYPDYHSGHVKQVMTRGPEVQQFLPYNRPELAVRDDIYTDTYKRSPHFSGFGPYPEMRQPRALSQDDTYLHTRSPQYMNAQAQFPHQGLVPQRGYGAMGEMPMPMPMGYMGNANGGQQQQYMRQGELVPMHGQMNNQNFSNQRYNSGEQMDVTSKGNKNNNSSSSNSKSYNNDDSYGTKSNKKTSYNNNNDDDYSNVKTSNNKTSKQEMYNDDYGYGNKSSSKKMYSNDDNYSNKSSNGNSNYGVGAKKGSSKQQQQQRYTNDDSSSDDDEDEHGSGKSGGKWGSKPLLKHSKGDTDSHGKQYDNEMGSKKSGKGGDYQSYGGNNMVVYDSGKKQSGQKHGSQSKSSSRTSYRNGGDSSSDEDESFAYTKKASKAGQHNQGVTKVQHSQGHGGKDQSRGFDSHVQSYGQQPKHTQFQSQTKSVELKVPICCDNCQRKVTACLEYIDGVESVLCDQWQKKVIVYGNVKPDLVLKRVKRVKKGAELWQQGPKRVPVY